MSNPNRVQRWTPERRIVADAMAKIPIRDVEEFYASAASVGDGVMDHAYEAADALVKQRDRLTFEKMKGLESLDDFNAIKVAYGEAMFLVGVEYGRQKMPR